jgi:hypothetical protein
MRPGGALGASFLSRSEWRATDWNRDWKLDWKRDWSRDWKRPLGSATVTALVTTCRWRPSGERARRGQEAEGWLRGKGLQPQPHHTGACQVDWGSETKGCCNTSQGFVNELVVFGSLAGLARGSPDVSFSTKCWIKQFVSFLAEFYA